MEEALVKRIMPNSLEAEQSVIGSMIMDKEAIMTAGEILIEEDFYHKQYGILFESMLDLFNAGEPVDLITLQNKLKEKDVPAEISSHCLPMRSKGLNDCSAILIFFITKFLSGISQFRLLRAKRI